MNSSNGRDPDEVALELGRLLGPLRRAVFRATRSVEGLPELPEAQIELLRVLAAEGALAPREAAARLRIAPSTVSNLVKAMAAAALVERTPDPHDARAVVLTPSSRALDLLARYDRASTSALSRAVGALPAADRETLAAALPVLEGLVPAVEVQAADAADRNGRGTS
ncbi:MarR family winged helix-turn-helix transcriptional regulator [Streptomyces sp. NPDC048304]|uniref:MarR family winged helix-turn-helix transcriptional regulator n=1 Tax=Streptomyces sp. NPDC048304 TaxID=3154820 RepID=UPI0033EFEB6E